MRVKILPVNNPPGKLADAELLFDEGDGLLAGSKLIGFGVWASRGDRERYVTLPTRQYAVNGERRSFSLLRAQVDNHALDGIRELILKAYAESPQEDTAAAR